MHYFNLSFYLGDILHVSLNFRNAVFAFLIVFSVSCANKQTGGKKNYNIAFVAGAATDFSTYAEAGCKKADTELENVSVEFKYTGDGAAAEQRRIIDDLLVKGIDGLVVTPLDAVNQGPMVNTVAKQVPVIITDSDIPNTDRLCYIGTSNVEAGMEAGKLVKELLPDGGKIMLFVGKTDAQNAKERIEGIEKVLEGSGIEIIDIKTDNIDRVRAKANVSDALVSHNDLDCLVGLWSYNGPAILNAVKESGKLGEVKIVCFDEEEETLNGVKDGHIYGTIVQQPFEFGYQSILLLSDIIKGNKSDVPKNGMIIIPTQIIKQDGAEAFLEKMRGLRS